MLFLLILFIFPGLGGRDTSSLGHATKGGRDGWGHYAHGGNSVG